MHRYAALALIPLLAGCEYFEQGQEVLEGLTNPLVTQGMVLGVEPPESDQVDLSGTDYEEGTSALIFLADAASADQLESAPVTGADVSLRGDQIGDVPLDEAGGGAYSLVPDGSVTYAPGAQWTVVVALGDDLARAHLELPAAAEAAIAQEHDQGAGIQVDLSGQGFDSALVVVLDGQSGEVTFSNEPEGIKEFYDFTHSSEPVTTVDIPGTAFPDQSVYAVGVAGLVNTVAGDLESMNTALSTVMTGKMRFHAVSTIEDLPG